MIRLLSGDCRDVLATLPAESVQCVVTSPPYYGLRDYQTGTWDGGDAACDHRVKTRFDYPLNAGLGPTGVQTQASNAASAGAAQYRDTCGKCGAVRVDRQIGLESDPDTYLATMVGVFREIRRVLRRDGTCWVNMGDSYSSGGNGTRTNNNGTGASSLMADGRDEASRLHSLSLTKTIGMELPRVEHGLAAKQLLLMPARLALALQADGWWVRSDIIWHKPNPMPESVTDRPTSAHEHVFLLTRSSRYFYDADAVREAHEEPWRSGNGEYARDRPDESLETGRPRSFGWQKRDYNPAGRNLRNVWSIATHAYPEAHFATFPPELAERCIKAGTSERGCCAACGKPWARVVENVRDDRAFAREQNPAQTSASSNRTINGVVPSFRSPTATTTGWSPGCDHGAETVPCTVLDPFAGAGTTLLVADRLQRDAIGIELNTAYTEMAMERCRQDAPLFTSFPPAEPPEDERMADLFTDMAAD